MELKGKNAVITGASKGIGKALAFALAKEGCNLALIARSKDKLEEVKREIRTVSVSVFVCDISDRRQVKNTSEKILKEFDSIDILINNAGIGKYRKIDESSFDEFEEVMKTNYFGVIYCIKYFLRELEKSSGVIINISSVAGKLAFPNMSAYCSSKFAVTGLSQSLQVELEAKGINVMLVCPAGTNTDFFEDETFQGHRHVIYKDSMMSPEFVAEKIVEGIKKGKKEIVIPAKEGLIVLLNSLFPNLIRNIQIKRFRKRIKEGVK